MSKNTTKIKALTRKLALPKFLGLYRKLNSKSPIPYNESVDQQTRNWGKTAEYMPEFGENHLATSLFQLELERAKATAVA